MYVYWSLCIEHVRFEHQKEVLFSNQTFEFFKSGNLRVGQGVEIIRMSLALRQVDGLSSFWPKTNVLQGETEASDDLMIFLLLIKPKN